MGRRVILRDVVQKNAKEIVLMDVAENKKNTGDLEATVVMTGAPKKHRPANRAHTSATSLIAIPG